LIAIFTCIATNTPYALRGDTNAFDINRKLTLKNKLRNRLLSYIFNKASALFYIGEENKKFYKSFGVKESQLIKMPFAIDNDYFESFNFDLEEKRKKLEIAPNQKVILFTGKLISIKQPKLLIESLKGIDRNKYLLLIVGDGELLNECKLLATKLNINCKFLGFINQTEIPKYYHLSDIYIFPSSKEAWGLAVNEAMNCNCAIIASDKVGSVNDLVKNNGFIFDYKDTSDLNSKIIRLLDDEQLLLEFKTNSKQIIKEYTFTDDVNALIEYFKNA
jgi:glycosyltransferase involved in cell wall biosynthesis